MDLNCQLATHLSYNIKSKYFRDLIDRLLSLLASNRKSEYFLMELEDLGFSDWFKERSKESQQHDYGLARVVAVSKNSYIVRNEEGEAPAKTTGKMIYGAGSNLDLPTVGEWVHIRYNP